DRRRFAPVIHHTFVIAPAIHHTFVIAKEACRLRQSKGLKGSDGSPRRFAPSNEHTLSLGELDRRRFAPAIQHTFVIAPAIQHTFVIAKEGCRLRQSKGEEGSDGSPRRCAPRDDNRWWRISSPASRKLRLIRL